MSVGDNIKKYRKNIGITQKELAEKSKLSESAIKYYESNRRNPKLETLEKIGDVLGVSINDLTNKEEKEKIINEYKKEKDKLIEQLKEVASDEEKEIIINLVNYYNKKFYNNEYDIDKFDDEHIQDLKMMLHGIIKASLRDCIK